jgi:phytoene dehydrogenase-like protein
MTRAIEQQIERFAPGFRDTILARTTKTAVEMERWNIAYLGGDISNGQTTLRQMLARPVPRWNTYKTPVPGRYLASAATPPGPAVHGACGDNAARTALREVFGLRRVPPLKPPVTVP